VFAVKPRRSVPCTSFDRIERPALGQHLRAAVRTGYFCAYEPDLRVRVDSRF
jgi:hypothetical protein